MIDLGTKCDGENIAAPSEHEKLCEALRNVVKLARDCIENITDEEYAVIEAAEAVLSQQNEPAPALGEKDELIRELSEFARFVIQCVKRNGSYSPATIQEPREIEALLAGAPSTGLSKGWNRVRQCDGFVIGHSSEEPSPHHKEQAFQNGQIYVPFLIEGH